MSNLIEIQSQIEKLQKQANEIKTREFDKTVQDILTKMSAFGITLKDLQPGKARKSGKRAGKPVVLGTKRPATRAKSKAAGTAVAAKYRGPNGETWSGRGLMPRWLAALVSQGQTRDEFLIKS
jgi:DNA-binding protein H-NS